jgi:uncharacterized protein (TIGR01777 family)
MATILISGGTGLIGTSLTKLLLAKGHKTIILTRNLKRAIDKQVADERLTYARWNAEEQSIDRDAIEKADFIVHLAGEGIADKRWTGKRKKQIVQSRIQSSGLLVKALKEIPNNVKAVVSASAIGWYGPDKQERKVPAAFVETDPPDQSFLGDACRWWEESIQPITQLRKRLIKFRFGVVLSNDGGALAEFKKPVRFGIASILGSGKQVVSWIHIDDLCRLITFAMENEQMQGVYNAVAPKPVTNKELMLQLAQHMRGKAFIPVHVPSWVLKTMLGEMSIEVLKSATVSSEKVQQTGFQFLYPQIDAALNDLIER